MSSGKSNNNDDSDTKSKKGQYDSDRWKGDWTLPKNVKPSEVKGVERPDGKLSITYGTERDSNGKITGDHGHTVVNETGDIDYARTQGGTEKTNTEE